MTTTSIPIIQKRPRPPLSPYNNQNTIGTLLGEKPNKSNNKTTEQEVGRRIKDLRMTSLRRLRMTSLRQSMTDLVAKRLGTCDIENRARQMV